ncbi:Heat shock protein 75 kDa, mitochondrial, partial [Smittium mucronatum]
MLASYLKSSLKSVRPVSLARSLQRPAFYPNIVTIFYYSTPSSFFKKKFGLFTCRGHRFQTPLLYAHDPENVFEFQAETKKLLQIVAHSLYSQREVFVRELISNASDAMEKLRYLSLTDTSLARESEPQIEINVDKDNKTISFQDHGIGMTDKELIENLGTIARSGSKKYMEDLKSDTSSSDAAKNIVGQFGVGFYSGFMIGDSIDVYSKSAVQGSKSFHW